MTLNTTFNNKAEVEMKQYSEKMAKEAQAKKEAVAEKELEKTIEVTSLEIRSVIADTIKGTGWSETSKRVMDFVNENSTSRSVNQ